PLADDVRALLQETDSRRRLLIASKSDLAAAWDAAAIGALAVSSLTDEGIASLRVSLAAGAGAGEDVPRDRPALANMRHAALLEKARDAVTRAAAAAAAGVPEECVLADLHEARGRFDEITGARPQDEVLRVIF